MKQNLQSQLKPLLLSLPITVLMVLFSSTIFAQVSGTVYQDLSVNGAALNNYGVKDVNELGVEGVTVTVFPGGMSAMTDANGDYSIAGAPVGAVRVEFTWPTLTWLQSSPDAAMQNTSVQFMTAPMAGVDFGLHDPNDFSNTTNPKLMTTRFPNGDPLLGGTTAGLRSIEEFNHDDSGTSVDGTTIRGTASETGALWGVTYDKVNKTLYTSAVIRRHSGLGNCGTANTTTGGIYSTDIGAGATSTTAWLDINTLAGVDTGMDPRTEEGSTLPMDFTQPSYDALAFSQVGKRGIGDMDISEDGKSLFVINLNEKTLLQIDIATQTLLNSYAIGCPDAALCGVSGNDYAPWGIGIHNGEVYIGVVTTGEASQDVTELHAYVQRLNGASFTTVLDFSLANIAGSYPRGSLAAVGNGQADWAPWARTFTDFVITADNGVIEASPILSDISFDIDGAMILGFIDRGSMQVGYYNFSDDVLDLTLYVGLSGGEILRAGSNGTGGWNIENNGSDGTTTTVGMNNGQGPGGGEFYFDDRAGSVLHTEISWGALAILPGSGEVAATAQNADFAADWYGGVNFYNNIDGTQTNGFRFTQSYTGTFLTNADKTGSFSKAAGLGDLEYMLAPAPVEIGNLVWDDTNSNGEQDADEAGIAGVTVELLNAGGVVITSAVTDANGNYIFSNDPNGSSTASHIYNITVLNPNTAYTLRVPTTNGGNNLTTANGAGGKDIIDSDANTGTGEAIVLATDIPVLGANNHTFDFGYGAAPPCPPTRCGTVAGVKN